MASSLKFSDLVKDAVSSDSKFQEKRTLICEYLVTKDRDQKAVAEIVAGLKHVLVKRSYCTCEKHRALQLLAQAMVESPSPKLREVLVKDLLGKMKE